MVYHQMWNSVVHCVISNQRPSSTVEFKNDGKAPKKVINFNQNNVCDACLVRKI